MALRYYVSSEEAPFFVNNKMGSSDRIPTSGTYKVGDFIISNTQADGIFGWVCTVAGTPGTWIEIGSGGGSNTKTLSLSSSTVVSSPVREVTIGIKDFNKTTDFLMVYKNSTYLTEGVDYDISSDSTKIVSRTGNWNADSLGDYRFSFVVIKEVEKVNPKAVVGTENIKDSVVTMSKLGEDVKERLDGFDSQLEDKINKHDLVISVIDFGAKGDGVADDTQAFQKAINLSTSNGRSLFIPPGEYLISSTLNIKNSGFTMYGSNSRDSKIIVSENFNNGIEFSPVVKIAMDNEKDAIDKINIYDLGFDAYNDTVNTRGIQFEFLIYSSSFRNLNFDYFTGACLYSSGEYNDRCEMITFEHIKMNPYSKILAEPQVNLTGVNESIFTNCRFFSKQNGVDITHNQPLLYLNSCQGIDIKSNAFFYSDNAPCIETYCNGGITQAIYIDTNTFERNNNNITIDIISAKGENGYSSEGVVIGNNRTNSTVYKIRFKNIRKSQILDPFASVVLEDTVDGCYFLTNSTYGTTFTDNTSDMRNTIIDIGSNYDESILRVTNKNKKTDCIISSGHDVVMKMKPVNSSEKTMKIKSSCQYSDWANAKFDFIFDGEIGATINPRGFAGKFVTTLPTASGLYSGMIYILNDTTTDTYTPYICIKENGVDKWKKIMLG